MKKRVLGQEGFTIGEVGLGCWQFGGDFGQMNEETAFEIMNTAVENGVNFFDTADVYGAGISEELIGRFAKVSPVPLTIATKFGRSADMFPDNYTKDNIRKAIEGALSRLQLDKLDLLQIHCIPSKELFREELFEWLREFKQEGLLKEFGASVETVEEGLFCIEQDELLTLQVIFNIFRSKLVKELLPQAKTKGVGIITRLPLASGLLAGKYTKETTFDETDHRNYNRDGKFFNVGETFAGLPFEKGVELADKLKLMLPDGMNMVQMALRWILDHDAVSVIIPGASTPNHSKANAAISAIPPLPESLHAELSKFYENEVKQYIRGPY